MSFSNDCLAALINVDAVMYDELTTVKAFSVSDNDSKSMVGQVNLHKVTIFNVCVASFVNDCSFKRGRGVLSTGQQTRITSWPHKTFLWYSKSPHIKNLNFEIRLSGFLCVRKYFKESWLISYVSMLINCWFLRDGEVELSKETSIGEEIIMKFYLNHGILVFKIRTKLNSFDLVLFS